MAKSNKEGFQYHSQGLCFSSPGPGTGKGIVTLPEIMLNWHESRLVFFFFNM